MKLSPDFAGANVYVGQHRSLKLLHGRSPSSSSSRADLLRPDGKRHCFDSHKGQVALYLESDSAGADHLRWVTAAFDYDLQFISEDPESSILSNDPWQGETLQPTFISASAVASIRFPSSNNVIIFKLQNADRAVRKKLWISSAAATSLQEDPFQPFTIPITTLNHVAHSRGCLYNLRDF